MPEQIKVSLSLSIKSAYLIYVLNIYAHMRALDLLAGGYGKISEWCYESFYLYL